MKKYIKRVAALTLAAIIAMIPFQPFHAYAVEDQTQPQTPAAAAFTDVPADSWAAAPIESAVKYGLMSGTGDGIFGYGQTITRAEYAALLCNMFGWDISAPDSPTFTDVNGGDWFYGYVETAAAQSVIESGGAFDPNAPVTRKDMAVMLIKALGYDALATQASSEAIPFDDVTSDRGYIAAAYDLGLINGIGGGKFAPDNDLKREEAAALLTHVYETINAPITWLHGFYAISSYGQKDMINSLNAVTFGWSAMQWDAQNGASLNTSSTNNNQWRIPDSYELIADVPHDNGINSSLGVYMDASAGLGGMIADEASQIGAVNLIIKEATRAYDALGHSPYDGVTIDFEGLKGADVKSEFTAFLSKLSTGLKNRGLSLYVAVQPVTSQGQYFDGYDYRAIGQLADKVILMAHDYEPASMNGFVGTDWQKNAALTPIAEIYTALKAVTDPDTGVEDKGKIALALSFSCVGWMIDADGKLTSPDPVTPSMDTVYSRMNQADTVKGWSGAYQNPYMIYTTENNERVFLWYEDSDSVTAKLRLARLFGVTGVSVWRLGIVPNYNGWDVWSDFS